MELNYAQKLALTAIAEVTELNYGSKQSMKYLKIAEEKLKSREEKTK